MPITSYLDSHWLMDSETNYYYLMEKQMKMDLYWLKQSLMEKMTDLHWMTATMTRLEKVMLKASFLHLD